MGWESCPRDSPGYRFTAAVWNSCARSWSGLLFDRSHPLCSRLNAEYGGTFLLNRAVNEIVVDSGRVKAVRSDGKAREPKDRWRE